MTGLEVLQAIAAMAGIISSLKNIFGGGEIDGQLGDILDRLQENQDRLIRAAAQILEAIDGIARQIDEDLALDNISLADRALLSDLAVFQNHVEAMGNSFQAADRLLQESDVTFASSFMYVVNIRLAVMKDFDPSYFCRQQFRDEFKAYGERLNGWIAALNTMIDQNHTVTFEVIHITEFLNIFRATHRRGDVPVESFVGPPNDLTPATRSRLARQANESRLTGIAADRENLGVVAMEATYQAWLNAFMLALRAALVTQVLNRRVRAIDANVRGFMADGRIVSSSLNPRATLHELLISREFRRQIERSWKAFLEQDDDRLVQFAHRRLFNRAARDNEVMILRQLATTFGYGAFIAALLHSEEYETLFGSDLPGGDEPVARALEAENERE